MSIGNNDGLDVNKRKRNRPLQISQSTPALHSTKKICNEKLDYLKASMDQSLLNAKLSDSAFGDIEEETLSSYLEDSNSSRICAFLEEISLLELKDLFTTEEVSFNMLLQMTESDLKDLGVVKYG